MNDLPLNIDLQQVFLHMLNFLILVLGLYLLLYSPIVKFMEQRKARYQEQKESADEHLRQAEDLLAKRTESLENLDIEIENLRKDKMAALELEAQAYIAQAKEESEEIRQKAKQEAENAKKIALEEAHSEVGKIIENTLREAIIDEEKLYQEFLDSVDAKEGD